MITSSLLNNIQKNNLEGIALIKQKAEWKLLGLDISRRKIGVALYDNKVAISIPYSILQRQSIVSDMERLWQLIIENNTSGIVIGLPLQLDGCIGQAAQYVVRFIEQFLASCFTHNIPHIFFQDERLSSKLADSLLRSVSMKRKKRDNIGDAVAAAVILDTFISRNLKN